MNYCGITAPDIANGTGCRVVLWISGCNHKCKGCHNPETHDINDGKDFDVKDIDEEIKKYAITFSVDYLSDGDVSIGRASQEKYIDYHLIFYHYISKFIKDIFDYKFDSPLNFIQKGIIKLFTLRISPCT